MQLQEEPKLAQSCRNNLNDFQALPRFFFTKTPHSASLETEKWKTLLGWSGGEATEQPTRMLLTLAPRQSRARLRRPHGNARRHSFTAWTPKANPSPVQPPRVQVCSAKPTRFPTSLNPALAPASLAWALDAALVRFKAQRKQAGSRMKSFATSEHYGSGDCCREQLPSKPQLQTSVKQRQSRLCGWGSLSSWTLRRNTSTTATLQLASPDPLCLTVAVLPHCSITKTSVQLLRTSPRMLSATLPKVTRKRAGAIRLLAPTSSNSRAKKRAVSRPQKWGREMDPAPAIQFGIRLGGVKLRPQNWGRLAAPNLGLRILLFLALSRLLHSGDSGPQTSTQRGKSNY